MGRQAQLSSLSCWVLLQVPVCVWPKAVTAMTRSRRRVDVLESVELGMYPFMQRAVCRPQSQSRRIMAQVYLA
jgi:hypothetical protein